MDYDQHFQVAIDALKQDHVASPKWRNKMISRLEELQAYALMLYEGRVEPTDTEEIMREAAAADEPVPPIPDTMQQFANGLSTDPQHG